MNYIKSKIKAVRDFISKNAGSITEGVHICASVAFCALVFNIVLNERRVIEMGEEIEELRNKVKWIERDMHIWPN